MSQEMNSVRGIVLQGHIINKKAQLVVQGLLDINTVYITAEAANREGLWAEEERLANRCRSRMAEEPVDKTTDGEDLVEHLLRQWYSGASFIQTAIVKEAKQGLAAAERDLALTADDGTVKTTRERWREAHQLQDQAIDKAGGLPPFHAEYFWCRIRQTSVSMARRLDIALGNPVMDFTQVRKKQTEGIPLFKIAEDEPWPMQEVYNRVVVSQADGDRLREWLGAMFIRQWPWDRQAPEEMRKLALAERDDIDSDTGISKSAAKKGKGKKEEK